MHLSISREEGNFFASKWIHVPVLASADELKELFSLWQNVRIFLLGSLLKKEEIEISLPFFLDTYRLMIEQLKMGKSPDKGAFKKVLPAALSLTVDALYLQEAADSRYLLKLRKPVIQLQAHYFRYSPVDHSVRSMVMGEGAVFWGIQISYPQIFQNPKTQEVEKSALFENEKLFLSLKKWMREFTRPTPFILPDGKKMNSPIRIGKSCFFWIAEHPDLKAKGLQVDAS